MSFRSRYLISYVFLILAALVGSVSCNSHSWASFLKQRYVDKSSRFPVLLSVVEEKQAASFLPLFLTSVLALPGRWEKSLTIVATTHSAKAICDQIHSGCFLEEQVFSHKSVNFTGSRAFKLQPSQLPHKIKVNRTAESLQITWGKVSGSSSCRCQAAHDMLSNRRVDLMSDSKPACSLSLKESCLVLTSAWTSYLCCSAMLQSAAVYAGKICRADCSSRIRCAHARCRHGSASAIHEAAAEQSSRHPV